MAFYLLVLLLLCIFGQSFGQSQLKLVTVLYRHGDRSPVKAFPTDPHQESAWPQGFGQLTQEGMRQHFELGQFLRKRYQGFLSEPYTRYEIAVRSTDYDRTLMSAESNLAGLYPPNGSQVFHPGLIWQPIPIHTVPQDQERLLSFPLSNCAYYERLMNETEKTEVFINMTRTYADFLEMVRNKTGVESTTIASIWSIHDTLFCEEKHGMTLPDWVTPEVMSTLQFLKNFGFQIMFGVHKRVEKSRLQGGLLLDQIIKNFTSVPSLNLNGQLKMIMYSAHDTTIVALHEALHVFNGLQPPYASCHIMELHQDSDGSFSVEIFYRNDSSVAEPYPLTIPGCAHHCPLKEFISLTQSVIPTDWDKECTVNTGSTDTGAGDEAEIFHWSLQPRNPFRTRDRAWLRQMERERRGPIRGERLRQYRCCDCILNQCSADILHKRSARIILRQCSAYNHLYLRSSSTHHQCCAD